MQAAVATQLCHHMCHLTQRQRTGNQTSHPGSGTTNPRNHSDCNITPLSAYLATARRIGQQMQHYNQKVAAKTLCHSASW